MKPLPITAEELVEELNKTIPEACPSLHMSDREIWAYAGKRDLVRHLLVRQQVSRELALNGGEEDDG